MSSSTPVPAAPPRTADSSISEADLRRAGWASSLGSALEYYDFALYSLASALIFSELFFTDSDPTTGRILAFATYFIGFAVRPLGGLFFGSLGDRIGRKSVLLLTVLLMGGASTAMGLLPTYDQVGILAPILLIVLRILQGFGAGAEQAGAATLMTEYTPRHRRGFFASLPFMGIQIGTVIAALVFFLLLIPSQQVVLDGLWRIPFLASAVLIGVAVYIRLKLKESPSFVKLEAHEQVQAKPLRNLLRTSRKTVLIGMGLRMAENGGSSIYQVLAISYVVTVALGSSVTAGPIGAISLVFAAAVGAITVPVAGLLSDRFGRVRVYRGFAIFQFVIAVPVWWILSTGNVVATVAAISVALGIGTWGMFGAQGALMPELFGSRHRYTGVSVAREFSAVIAGGLVPLVGALLLAWFSDSWVPLALYLLLLTGVTIAVTFITPETRGRDLDLETDAVDDASLPAAAPASAPVAVAVGTPRA
ncbi:MULTISPECIES: MFS transporter [unclassified Cryobacterium]|uniref:MFS transporter n=1 Tax=unclassified Cryobacterium TaxID=2649013 RepID=UPI001069B1EE|nr:MULTISPECIES: MFS transporter [unclassified Cryobacterium]TFC53668.1 MFS transporter [Cryobacterium sp. TMB3-1-2]TFC75087.1 MFS transporter [Cryobacterium sp. TMB3-15]TFC75223.1 MFS transporter [Cryobacterium sp. TMB3-10]TFD41500.1 MFS transporter [Cryobacterium sp. TMB3-12]